MPKLTKGEVCAHKWELKLEIACIVVSFQGCLDCSRCSAGNYLPLQQFQLLAL